MNQYIINEDELVPAENNLFSFRGRKKDWAAGIRSRQYDLRLEKKKVLDELISIGKKNHYAHFPMWELEEIRDSLSQEQPFDPCGEKCEKCPDNCAVDCKSESITPEKVWEAMDSLATNGDCEDHTELDEEHLNMRVLGRGKQG